MEKQTQTYKERGFGLYSLAFERIKECERVRKELIPLPKIFQKLCRSFSITKKEAWELLWILRDFGLIEIVPYNGVRIK
jgi:hypothetical protein